MEFVLRIPKFSNTGFAIMPSRVCRRVTAVFLTTNFLGLLTSCAGTKAAAPPPSAVPVVAATVEQKDVPQQLRAIGAVEPYSTVAVKTQITGELTGVFFREGEDVKKGQLLFTLDKRPLEAELKKAEGTLAKDQAQAEHARVQQQRYEVLYCSIYSPINGRTGGLMVHQGNEVKANDVPVLVNINQVEPIYVTFMVPEQNLAEIKKYASQKKLQVEANIPNDSRGKVAGTLSFIDNAVDQTTGTIKLKGQFPNIDRRLWPGQFVDAVLTLRALPNAIVVPSQAVQNGQQGQFVFVIKNDMTVEARPIVVSQNENGQAVIQSGLAPGERVVTDGQLRLVPGSKVQVKQALKLTSQQEPQS